MLIRHSFYQILGRFSALLSGVISAPIYMAYLGAESFGVVGVYLSFFAFLSLFDFGLPVSANREISVLLEQKSPPQELFGLVRAFELVIYAVALIGGGALVLCSGFLAEDWLNSEILSVASLKHALVLAAIAAMLRFPSAFYNNILFAFERHLSANAVTAFFSISRVIITLLFLELYEATLVVFFWCQIVLNLLEVLFLAFLFWYKANALFFIKPAWHYFKKSASLTFALSGISVTALIQSQIDKILLSKWLSLSDFGVYSLACSLVMGVLPLAYAVGNATFPKLSRLLSDTKKNAVDIKALLIRGNALIVLLVIPLGVAIALSVDDLHSLFGLFTKKDMVLSELLGVMFFGAMLQALVVLPHHYRVGGNRANTILYINLVCIIPYGLLLYYGVFYLGIKGAAIAFLFGNAIAYLLHAFSLSLKSDRLLWGGVLKKNLYLLLLVLCICIVDMNFISSRNILVSTFIGLLYYVTTFCAVLIINAEAFRRKIA